MSILKGSNSQLIKATIELFVFIELLIKKAIEKTKHFAKTKWSNQEIEKSHKTLLSYENLP